MIRKKELEQVREINRKLPFAHSIEPGPTFKEWAGKTLSVKLFPFQVHMAEAIMRGEQVIAPRQVGRSTVQAAVRWYIEDGTDG